MVNLTGILLSNKVLDRYAVKGMICKKFITFGLYKMLKKTEEVNNNNNNNNNNEQTCDLSAYNIQTYDIYYKQPYAKIYG